ncbi:MAG: ABC transporter permease [Anaerolineae bacterium]|nr:ABC transporter permease [Anaerolineae bacterium]
MFKPRWRKVLADLWGNKSRTLLVIASIAVGAFAIGVITGTYVILTEDLSTSYADSNPANITLATLPFDHDLVNAIDSMNGIARAEGRRAAIVRLRTGPDTWDTLKLTAIPDYEESTIHKLFPREGELVPQDHEVILEHQTLDALGVTIGSILEIELPDGTRRTLPIKGTVLDQTDLYDLILGEKRGYITFDTLKWLHQPDNLNRLYVTVAENNNDKDHIREMAALVTDRLERTGQTVYQTTISRTEEHPLSGIIEALLMVLIIIGVLIMFLSGSLIANTMSALLNQHLRQIGVMKLVGARRFQVVSMYMVLISSFGVLALVIAIPLGSWGAYALSQFAAGIINFELQGFRIVFEALIIQIVTGLLLPPLAGLWPVLKGSRITIRKALTSTGLTGEGSQKGWVDQQLTQMRQVSRPLLISLRNTFRRKARLALTLFTLTLGGAVFIAVFNSQAALDNTIAQTTRYFAADVNLDFTQSYRITEVTQEALKIEGVEKVEVWTITGGELVHADGTTPDPVAIIAPPSDSTLVEPNVIEGRWLLPGDENAIAVNEAFWKDYPDLHTGDILRLKIAGKEDNWTIVGVFQYTGVNNLVAYTNYEYLSTQLKETQRATTYRIATTQHTLAYQEGVRDRLDAHFRELGYKVNTVEAGKSMITSVSELLGLLTSVMLVMALMTALVGSIGLTGTMSMNVMERTREIGVMRAIGAHDQIVSKLVIIEGLIIGSLSYIFGSILSIPISALLSNVISLSIFNFPAELAFTPVGFLIWLAVVLILSALASLIPARNASKLTIREVLAYE